MSYDDARNQSIAINVGINAAVALAAHADDPLNRFLESVELIVDKVLEVHAQAAVIAAFPGTAPVPVPAAVPAPAPVQFAPAPPAIPAPVPAPAPIPGAADGDPTVDGLWRQFFADVQAGQLDRWHDNRSRKASGQYKRTAPDFKNKADGDKALWISDRKNPSWVAAAVAQLGI